MIRAGKFKFAIQKHGKAFFVNVTLHVNKESVEGAPLLISFPELPEFDAFHSKLGIKDASELLLSGLYDAGRTGIENACRELHKLGVAVLPQEIDVTDFQWNSVDTKPECAYFACYWALMKAYGFNQNHASGPVFDRETFEFNFRL